MSRCEKLQTPNCECKECRPDLYMPTPAYQEKQRLKARIEQLTDALQMAANGIKWYVENSPEANGCDDEAMAEIERALSGQPLDLYQKRQVVIETAMRCVAKNNEDSYTFYDYGNQARKLWVALDDLQQLQAKQNRVAQS